MSSYQEKLASAIAEIPNHVKTARKFYTDNAGTLNSFHGGMPVGFMCAIATVESGGRMVAGDPSLGEFGYFQIASSTESTFGVASGVRTQPAGNVFLAGLEYNVEARRLSLKYPAFVSNGSWDQWYLARLVFALGRYGTTSRLDKAIALGYVSYGNAYNGLVRYMNAHEPGTKEWYRIVSVGAVQKPIADQVIPLETAGAPKLPTAPIGLAYKIPKDLAGKMVDYGNILGLAVLGAVFYLL